MKKQPERREITRRKLMDSFWQLYCCNKIERITVKEIVNGAGLYRSTFYEYFLDVYDVLETIERQLLEDLQAANSKSFASENLDDLVENIIAFYEQNGERVVVLMGPNGDPAFSVQAMSVIKESLFFHLHLTPSNMENDLLFDLLASTILTLLNYWYAHQDVTNLREVFMIGWQPLKNAFLPYIKTLTEIDCSEALSEEERKERS